MIVVRDPEVVNCPAVRGFIQQRIELMRDGGDYDPEEQGYFIVIEPGDRAEDVQANTGCPLGCFGDEDFAPMFEYVEDQGDFYEIVYIFNDSGFAHIVIVPKLPGIDPRLIQLCGEYA